MSFQTNPRGVEAARTRSVRLSKWTFQTNPRGVEALAVFPVASITNGFRRTLVGLKLDAATHVLNLALEFQTNPRGVEATQTLPPTCTTSGFRRTLVGLKLGAHLDAEVH